MRWQNKLSVPMYIVYTVCGQLLRKAYRDLSVNLNEIVLPSFVCICYGPSRKHLVLVLEL